MTAHMTAAMTPLLAAAITVEMTALMADPITAAITVATITAK